MMFVWAQKSRRGHPCGRLGGVAKQYLTGSAWSLYDVPTHAIWQETLRHEQRILQHGLELVEH